MKFGLWYLVILDDGTPFKGTFVTMDKTLDINDDILANYNYKDLTVEYFHHFLNKAILIVMGNRQTNGVFVPTGIAAGYVWNSTPIDGTNNLRSTVALDREFCFLIDIKLPPLPQLIQKNAQSTFNYLRLTDSNYHFHS